MDINNNCSSSMFKRFTTQDERRECVGSDCIEFQFCKLPDDSPLSSVLSLDNIYNHKLDSLYVSDYFYFAEIYAKYFNCGIYANMKCGIVDVCGINYYKADIVEKLISDIEKDRPEDYTDLLDWLKEAKNYNGFYILGV